MIKNYYMIFAFSLNFFCFIVKVESASRVSKSTHSIENEARKIDESIYKNVCVYIRFLKNCKEISMTLWNLVPMKRNLILGASRAILTYCLLFDGLVKF